MEGSVFLMLSGAFLWGFASILLSPCHLASIPLIVGYIVRTNEAGAKRGLALSVVFSLGVFTVLASIGGITAGMGRIAGNVGRPVTFALAACIVLVGLFITGLISFPDSGRSLDKAVFKKGYACAFLLGLVFGAGLGPCAFAFMVPVLSAVFSISHTVPMLALSLVFAYALGHCFLIAAAGASSGAVAKWLSLNDSSSVPKTLRVICGVLVSLSGIYLFAKTW